MASSSTVSTTLDLHLTISHPNKKPTNSFSSPSFKLRKKRFTILCNSTQSHPNSVEPQQRNSSLSDQLKPLTQHLLSDNPQPQPSLLSKPKSIWVNPSKPKRSVLSLQRHKRPSYSYNPQLKDLKLFCKKLNDCDPSSESAFLTILEEIPQPLTRENALSILNFLKPWPKTHLFFNWLKTQKEFPIETIFYNVTMKSLRFGRQFQLIEELAHEMMENEVELDNITYSTIITCAKRSDLFDKAVEWFERMYKTGLMPDEVTYSAILDVYAKLGRVEEVLSLYERGRASGWKPDPIAFSILGKMFGEAGDYDGIRYVLQEMKSLEVEPNLVVYNTLLEAMGKAGKPGLARTLFEEMVELGVTPNEKTLTALIKIYGKARWGKDALELWERMKTNGWKMDFMLYNTLLSMCADLGFEEEAAQLFEEMKNSKRCRPDTWSYTAMLNIYGRGGKVDNAMKLFGEMCELGVKLNVMGCTCLIQCLGRAKRIEDLVTVFSFAVERGIEPDDRLCGCLLSVASLCEEGKEVEMVLDCLEKGNSKLVGFAPPQPEPEPQTSPDFDFQSKFRDKILYLDSIGIDFFSLMDDDADYPLNLILSSSLEDMKATVEFIRSMGFTALELRRICGMCPEILNCKISDIARVFTFLLREANVMGSDLRRVINRRPRLLACDVEKRLRPTLYFLQSLGIPEVQRYTFLLSCSVEDKFIPRIEYLEKIGFSYGDVVSMVRRFPQLFCYSIKHNFEPKFDYFVVEMGRDLTELREFPQYFSFSLENRIKPRHRYCVEKGVCFPLPVMLKMHEKQFRDTLEVCRSSSPPLRTSPLWCTDSSSSYISKNNLLPS